MSVIANDNMHIPQIELKVGMKLTSRVKPTENGYRLELFGRWFDKVWIERVETIDYNGDKHVVEHEMVKEYGFIHAFDTPSDMLKFLARWMHDQKGWFEQAYQANRASGHDYGWVHVCIPITDRRGEESNLGWALYKSYMFDLFDLLHAIKQFEEGNLFRPTEEVRT